MSSTMPTAEVAAALDPAGRLVFCAPACATVPAPMVVTVNVVAKLEAPNKPAPMVRVLPAA